MFIAFFRSFELLLGRWWVLGPSSIFRVSYTKGCWIANGWHGACGRQAWSLGNISFFSLTSTRSLLKHKFYAHYTVNSLSVPLCSVNTNTKSCFSFRQFWRQIQKKIWVNMHWYGSLWLHWSLSSRKFFSLLEFMQK